MKKKLLSLFMACAMILALAVPAFAENYNVNPDDSASEDLTQTVTIATRTFVPTVKLTLPTLTEPSVVLNPYKISFTGDNALVNGQQVADPSSGTNPDQVKQVISPVYAIKNETDVKLNYTVAVTGSVEGGVTFSNDPVTLEEKNKKAHVALMVANKSLSADPSTANNVEQDITGITALGSDFETLWLKNSEVKSSKPKVLSDASKENNTDKANWLAFQFKGDLTRQPTPNSWTADDKIGAVITFTFTPESAQDFTVPSASGLTIGSAALSQAATSLADDAVSTNAVTTLVPADGSWKVHATTPNWGVYNGGAYGATLDSNNKVKLDATALKAITGTSSTAVSKTDKIVLKFTDTDGLPRTVEVPISFTITT